MKKHLLTVLALFYSSSLVFSQILVEENFNGTLPADWTISTNASDGGWKIGSATTLSSQFWPIGNPPDGSTFIATNDDQCNCDKREDRLIFPTIDLSGNNGALFLNFDLTYGKGNYGVDEALFLEVSYDGGTTWEILTEIEGGGIAWRNVVYDVSEAAGNSSVNFAFRYSDNGGWLFGAAVDNVILRIPNDNDVRLELDDIYKFADTSIPFDITGTVTNVGGQTLTEFEVVINDGTNTVTENITGISIAPLSNEPFSISLNFPEPTTYDINVAVNNPNGVIDENTNNNSSAFQVTGVMNPPSKMVFVEESTGTWCIWCPRGAVFMELMEGTFPESFAGVAVHVGIGTWPDPMELPSYASQYNTLVSGYPTLVIDRNLNPGIPGLNQMLDFGAQLLDYTKSRPSPIGLNVDANIDEMTREMSIDLEITAHSNINANYSVMLIITEDHVTGDAFAYRQANIYSGGGQGPMGGWENLANPAPGNQIEFNHVVREAIGGFNGDPTLIPATINAGDSYSHSLTYNIPAEWDMQELNVVAVILDGNNNFEVYNAGMIRDIPFATVSVQEISSLNTFEIFPNPVSESLNVNIDFTERNNFNISVFDVTGNRVKDFGNFSDDMLRNSFDVKDLSNGMYFLRIQTADGQNTLKFNRH